MQVKGTAVETIPLFVKSKFGEEAYQKWMQALSENTRAEFSRIILATKWYPLRQMFEEPTVKICDMFYQGKLEGAVEQGRFSAEYGLRGIYKLFVKLGSPEFIVSRASSIMPTYYDPCAMEVADKGEKTVTIRITKFDEPSRIVEHRIKGWTEKALEISGAKDCAVTIAKSLADGAATTDIVCKWS